ncbi:unnamed protein product [Symbiodinium necroappetens]|uniref:Uncharacterized protein n=1 Tax=Symbiodinium necroappetens TaxID=1628268 RepID=A0A812SFN4_9DINO|nr:unnamed protein product [Symbiodinium necroappetens]
MIERPKHEQFRKDRRSKHKRVHDGHQNPHSHPTQANLPALRKQILRIASETFDEMDDDSEPPQSPPPAPCTPPYPPPPPEEDEPKITNLEQPDQNITSQDIVDMTNNLHHALKESHNKLESLFQKTTTVLVTQHSTRR